ncbi:MAG: ATP-binding cassette domain-containing protein [Acidimicrobiia bacterium]|nr:ATP-binding cassette domain-containing protein [Acidimicrobiia bacterium]
MTAPAIHASRLTRRFGDTVAVAGVDLSVAAGEIYGFLGPNGAGKSTCVRMLCTLLAPTSGSATVAGHNVLSDPGQVRLRIGVALQDAALDPKLTGRELLAVQARLYGMSKRQAAIRLGELAGLVDMTAIDRRIETYSGGMRRRLDLAAALIHDPEVVFMDEPTTGLDPDSRVRVWDELRRLNRDAGVTVFLTTQYLEEADELADRVGIICRGELVAEGAPTDLKRRIGTDVIIVAVDGDAHAAAEAVRPVAGVESVEVHGDELTVAVQDGSRSVSPVAVALDTNGATVTDLRLRSPSLDDVYLELTGARLAVEGS